MITENTSPETMSNPVKTDLLRCPACGSNLSFLSGNAEIKGQDGVLKCASCGKTYPVIRGIPRFVDSDLYVSNFSFEWKIHQKTQVDDGRNRDSENNFYSRFGLPKEFFKGKKVLDVGVGVGRYAKVALDAGAEVFGIDLSYAVDVARANLGEYSGFHLVQGDAFAPPFALESFDVIYSFGVLHHTPDPRAAFDGLLKFLKPGGIICLTLYMDYGMYHNSYYIRKLTTRLPNAVLYPLCVLMTLLLYIPYKFFGLRLAFLPISLSKNLKEAILDTYDCYSPKYQFTYSVHEVFAWFKEAGLNRIEARPQPVTVLGYK